jgi:hypothetical protein
MIDWKRDGLALPVDYAFFRGCFLAVAVIR